MRGQEFLSRLENEIIVGDGAMGTMICARGVPWNACLEAANIEHPELVKAIHLEYVAAGSGLIETNTFGANRNRLKAAGYDGQARDINAAAVRLAREVVPESVFLGGSMGPFGRADLDAGDEPTDLDKAAAFREQAEVLLEEGVDLLLLETFSDADEIRLALSTVRSLSSDVPVFCQMAFSDAVRTTGRSAAVRGLLELEKLGAAAIGGNCGSGPAGIIHVVEELGHLTASRLTAQPNASYPQYVNGRLIYLSDPAYFAESAERLVEAGANFIGGCCGTTPGHIRLVAERLKGRAPAARMIRKMPPRKPARKPSGRRREPGRPAAPKIYSPLDRIGTTKVTLVELKPPRGMAMGAVRRAAALLKDAGVDAYSLVESSLAQVRMSPFAMAHLLQEEFGVAAVVHCTCRDRNLMGQQSELTGAAALGVRTILALTGDPASIGDMSESTSVYDTNSIGLIRLIANLNLWQNVSGNKVSGSSEFVIGAALDPNATRLAPAIRRLEKKIEAGAHFVMTQPIFDVERMKEMYEQTADLGVPVFLGVMPLVSYRNASFLHNEVPGIRIPVEVLKRMKEAPKEAAQEEGLAIAKEMVEESMSYAPGFYIMPQLEKYLVAAELVKYIGTLQGKSALTAAPA